MIKAERHRYILDQLGKEYRVYITALSRELGISDDTIRRDLNELDEAGLLTKVHGGAIVRSGLPVGFSERVHAKIPAKREMAQKVIPLFKAGDVVLIDGGTSNLELVRLLPRDLELTVYTNSFPIANELFYHPSVKMVFIGGDVFSSSQVTYGTQAFQALQSFRPDWAVIGVCCVDPEKGVTGPDREEALLKSEMIRQARQRVILADNHKLNTTERYAVASLSEIDYFVVEDDKVESIQKDWPDGSYTVL